MQVENPLLSVVMITYGHEKYIRESIEGVFIQKTNFPIELIISNDCSPDNTDEIVNKTIKNAPQNIKVKYFRHQENIGMNRNHQWALQQTKGKYVAICDGDDYWINENKLQTQVDYLEQNPDYTICCHNFKILDKNTLLEESFLDKLHIKNSYTIEDLSKNNIIATLTAVFRNKKIIYPDWTKEAPLGDLILFLNIAQEGEIKYFHEKWAVYRKNVGVWHKNKVDHLKMIELYSNLINDYKHLKKVKNNLNTIRKKYIKAFLKELKPIEIFKSSYFNILSFIEKIKLLIIVFIKFIKNSFSRL